MKTQKYRNTYRIRKKRQTMSSSYKEQKQEGLYPKYYEEYIHNLNRIEPNKCQTQ